MGAELTPRLHRAADCQYERPTGGPHLRAWTSAPALTFSVTNETLNIGLQGHHKESHDSAGPTTIRNKLGPCIQYQPIDQLRFDCVAHWGAEPGRAVHGIFVSAGFEFGSGADDHDDDHERGGQLAH